MANDNVIQFPLQKEEQQFYEVTAVRCPEENCGCIHFFLEISDARRVICSNCFTTIRTGW